MLIKMLRISKISALSQNPKPTGVVRFRDSKKCSHQPDCRSTLWRRFLNVPCPDTYSKERETITVPGLFGWNYQRLIMTCQVCSDSISYAHPGSRSTKRRIPWPDMASIATGMLWYPLDGCWFGRRSRWVRRILFFRSATRLFLYVIISALLVDLLINFNILWNSQSIREMALL